MKSYLLMLAAAASLTACSKSADTGDVAADSPGANNVSVADLNRDFIGAWNSKDLDKTLGYLDDDVQFVQGTAHFSGKSEVGNKWVRATQSTISNLKTSVVSSGSDANMAYEAGTFAVDVLPEGPGQPAGFGEGNFILLWKKAADGAWKLSYAQLEDQPVRAR